MSLEADLAAVLIEHRDRVRTNTPADVLAAHMVKALELFEETLLERARHPFYAPGQRNGP